MEVARDRRTTHDVTENVWGVPHGAHVLIRKDAGVRVPWDDRLRVIVNAMTRLRFCTDQGVMDFRDKGNTPPPGFRAWFDTRVDREEPTIVCGHWSTLGLKLGERLLALDSGCVWGGKLSAVRLEDRALFQVPCRCHQPLEKVT